MPSNYRASFKQCSSGGRFENMSESIAFHPGWLIVLKQLYQNFLKCLKYFHENILNIN